MSVLSWLILQKRFELIVEKPIRYIRVSRRIKRVSVESLSNGRGSWVEGTICGSWVWVWVKVVVRQTRP